MFTQDILYSNCKLLRQKKILLDMKNTERLFLFTFFNERYSGIYLRKIKMKRKRTI